MPTPWSGDCGREQYGSGRRWVSDETRSGLIASTREVYKTHASGTVAYTQEHGEPWGASWTDLNVLDETTVGTTVDTPYGGGATHLQSVHKLRFYASTLDDRVFSGSDDDGVWWSTIPGSSTEFFGTTIGWEAMSRRVEGLISRVVSEVEINGVGGTTDNKHEVIDDEVELIVVRATNSWGAFATAYTTHSPYGRYRAYYEPSWALGPLTAMGGSCATMVATTTMVGFSEGGTVPSLRTTVVTYDNYLTSLAIGLYQDTSAFQLAFRDDGGHDLLLDTTVRWQGCTAFGDHGPVWHFTAETDLRSDSGDSVWVALSTAGSLASGTGASALLSHVTSIHRTWTLQAAISDIGVTDTDTPFHTFDEIDFTVPDFQSLTFSHHSMVRGTVLRRYTEGLIQVDGSGMDFPDDEAPWMASATRQADGGWKMEVDRYSDGVMSAATTCRSQYITTAPVTLLSWRGGAHTTVEAVTTMVSTVDYTVPVPTPNKHSTSGRSGVSMTNSTMSSADDQSTSGKTLETAMQLGWAAFGGGTSRACMGLDITSTGLPDLVVFATTGISAFRDFAAPGEAGRSGLWRDFRVDPISLDGGGGDWILSVNTGWSARLPHVARVPGGNMELWLPSCGCGATALTTVTQASPRPVAAGTTMDAIYTMATFDIASSTGSEIVWSAGTFEMTGALWLPDATTVMTTAPPTATATTHTAAWTMLTAGPDGTVSTVSGGVWTADTSASKIYYSGGGVTTTSLVTHASLARGVATRMCGSDWARLEFNVRLLSPSPASTEWTSVTLDMSTGGVAQGLLVAGKEGPASYDVWLDPDAHVVRAAQTTDISGSISLISPAWWRGVPAALISRGAGLSTIRFTTQSGGFFHT